MYILLVIILLLHQTSVMQVFVLHLLKIKGWLSNLKVLLSFVFFLHIAYLETLQPL